MDIWDYLYPNATCPGCGGSLFGDAPWCSVCGRKLHQIDRSEQIVGEWVRGHVLFRYEDPARRMVLDLKYNQKRYLAARLAGPMARTAKRIGVAFDAVIPVPAHPSRIRFRGFNQAGLLAEEVARQMGLPLDPDYLVRIRKTGRLKEFGRDKRLRILENAFALSGVKAYRQLLLIDDIYTTGATIDACGRVLYEGGADLVVFVAFSGND